MLYRTRSYQVFTIANTIFLSLLGLLCILPLIHIFAVSISSRAAATANIVNFWPVGFTTDAYVKTLGNEKFLRSLWIGAERTVLGTIVSMAVVTMASYSLSKTSLKFPGRQIYMWLFVFTMLFSGGLIPSYILITKLHLIDSIWSLVLPTAVSVWNMILMLNFFRTIPVDLEEAAYIDGAGHLRVLWSVYLPVSMASIATLSLFTMVFHWNSWFDGVIYMSNPDGYPLSSYLHSMIVSDNLSRIGVTSDSIANFSSRTIKTAQIFIGALPILLVYPFLQKYFVKGIVLGSVKS
ncbi:aldotetraouronic acid ABC transporter membrane protein 1 /aldotetraouronic acid ABC transporter membrane protein 2 [Paenibacillus taihuensis]|uniref:Aldotetraouronic acid ABC transporter membrane protein 1 /aldotetraouronic acid ABC transporter membrane protein 2 n=1 Tax=Paenibacillus taihuensis TaxID=1156355 RepID=A0A3D9SE30_9BACL|nr:carbohydrate ABC transporter permease [Paenibacillus taihuensis]REE93126.1 aldotetraouronic acid ABC transporter membrane protein 1 /aldotetraouronic acid ABC transporter membrane protein 2 [Paenibacillus taihuensis]